MFVIRSVVPCYVCRTFIFAVLRTSIPLRSISVAGLRPMLPYKKAGWKASFPHAFLYGSARLETYTQKKHKLILLVLSVMIQILKG